MRISHATSHLPSRAAGASAPSPTSETPTGLRRIDLLQRAGADPYQAGEWLEKTGEKLLDGQLKGAELEAAAELAERTLPAALVSPLLDRTTAAVGEVFRKAHDRAVFGQFDSDEDRNTLSVAKVGQAALRGLERKAEATLATDREFREESNFDAQHGDFFGYRSSVVPGRSEYGHLSVYQASGAGPDDPAVVQVHYQRPFMRDVSFMDGTPYDDYTRAEGLYFVNRRSAVEGLEKVLASSDAVLSPEDATHLMKPALESLKKAPVQLEELQGGYGRLGRWHHWNVELPASGVRSASFGLAAAATDAAVHTLLGRPREEVGLPPEPPVSPAERATAAVAGAVVGGLGVLGRYAMGPAAVPVAAGLAGALAAVGAVVGWRSYDAGLSIANGLEPGKARRDHLRVALRGALLSAAYLGPAVAGAAAPVLGTLAGAAGWAFGLEKIVGLRSSGREVGGGSD